MGVWSRAATKKLAGSCPRRQDVSAHGLLQDHSAVSRYLCMTFEGGFDLGTALLDGRGARRVYGDDASQELL